MGTLLIPGQLISACACGATLAGLLDSFAATAGKLSSNTAAPSQNCFAETNMVLTLPHEMPTQVFYVAR